MKIFYKFLTLVVFSFFTAMSFAQINNQVVTNQIQFEECSLSPIMTPQQRLIYDQARGVRSNWEKAETTLDFPIQFHIIRETNGTGGLDPLELQGIMNGLNSYYDNANMQFYECSNVNYIDDSGNYDFLSTNKTSFTSTHDISGVINIYFFNSICKSGCGGSAPVMLCGKSTFPASMGGGSAGMIMDNSCALNGTTMTHEVGHFFSLLHTHETAIGTELVSRTSFPSTNWLGIPITISPNCSSAGDELCSTEADWWNSGNGLSGLVNTSCVYTGNAVDAYGYTYVPDPTNLMSYARKSCRTFLSNGQYNRINYSAVNDPDRNNLTGSSCGSPDLYITNESYNTFSGPLLGTPAPVSINGLTVSYNVDVKNSTSGSGCIPSEIGYYLSTNPTISTGDIFLGDDNVNALAPGSSETTTASFNLASPSFNSISNGTYYIGAYVDYSELVSETSGSNNGAAFEWTSGLTLPGVPPTYTYYQITIWRGCTDSLASNYNPSANIDDGSCTYPDLEITNEHHSIFLCFPLPCVTSAPVVVSGSVIDFNVDVKNSGTGDAAATQLGYYLSLNANIVPGQIDHLLGTDQVDGGGMFVGLPPILSWFTFDLAVDSISTETATFDLSDPSYNNIADGTYYIGAYADYDYSLHETNESNNDAAFNWTNNIFLGNIFFLSLYTLLQPFL